MPSKEWLEQHRKVQVYLTKELGEKLDEWMQENEITQVTEAVVTIFEDYLNNKPNKQKVSAQVIEDVETLKKEMAFMKSLLVEVGAKTLAPKISVKTISYPTERMNIEYTEEQKKKGFSQGELCEIIQSVNNELTISELRKALEEEKLELSEYLFKISGCKKRATPKSRYFPQESP